MKLLITLILASTLFAQTGSIYIPTAAETATARHAYIKVVDAQQALQAATDEWNAVKAKVAKAHGLSETDSIYFNGEFTVFERSAALVGSGYITCGMCTYTTVPLTCGCSTAGVSSCCSH